MLQPLYHDHDRRYKQVRPSKHKAITVCVCPSCMCHSMQHDCHYKPTQACSINMHFTERSLHLAHAPAEAQYAWAGGGGWGGKPSRSHIRRYCCEPQVHRREWLSHPDGWSTCTSSDKHTRNVQGKLVAYVPGTGSTWGIIYTLLAAAVCNTEEPVEHMHTGIQ